MKQKKNSVREYKFSDGMLVQKADSVAQNVLRDILLFAIRGVTNAVVTAFKAMIKEFDDIPTDEELLGDLSVATEKKDQAAELLKNAIRTIRTMADNKWGTHSAYYRSFAFEGLDALPDDQLHRMAKRVIRVANKQLDNLAPEGLTAAFITSIETLDTSFDNDMDLQIDAVNERDIKTQERIDKGNIVYKEMVRLCNTGKDLFAATDEAKHNDYIIYDTPTGNAPLDGELFGSIHGTITDAVTREPIANVPIVFEKVIEPAESDEDGDFEKDLLPITCKSFTAELFGYDKYEGSITLLPDDDITFDFMMTPTETPPAPPVVE